MNESIQLQHFEWAAKLRDIYFHLQKFVEKQHVVLSLPLSGRFFKIKKIADRLIFVMFNFFEGKMIDIIRHQQSLEDTDISSVLQMFLVEFGDWVIWLQDRGQQTRIEMTDVDALKDHQTLFAYQDFLSCPKTLAKEIDHLANQALDTFIM
jgi:excinuclease UvrABC nuclease subunit